MPWATVYFLNRFEYVKGSYWFDIYRLHMFGLSVLVHAHESIYLKPILRLFGFFFPQSDISVWVRLRLTIMREKINPCLQQRDKRHALSYHQKHQMVCDYTKKRQNS